jgi:hypothetical protein
MWAIPSCLFDPASPSPPLAPVQWSTLVNVRILGLETNLMTGSLPPAWSSLTGLWYLSLVNNTFTVGAACRPVACVAV